MNAALERQYTRTTALIRAAEDWPDEYRKDPKSFGTMLKLEAKWQLELNKFFKQLAANAAQFMNPWPYLQQVSADYNIEVIVNDVPIADAANTFLKISLETVSFLVETGVKGGETIYGIPTGLSSTSEIIQKLGLDQVAGLVGKKVLPDGSIVPNPNAAYNITETMRNDIAQSIKTSLALGENMEDATTRIAQTIANPNRARIIAETESVNAYQAGLMEFAHASDARGKEWLDAGAVDICADNSAAGPIPIDDAYPSGKDAPTQHPHCRCGQRLIYLVEWKQLGFA